MRRDWAWFVVGVLVLAGAPALAQEERGPGRGRGGGGGPGRFSPTAGMVNLIADPQVAGALELSEEQKGFVAILKEESTKEDEEFFSSLEGVERDQRMEKVREYMGKRGPEIEESIKEILGEEKLKRLKQIRLQIAGVMALMSPEVAGEIGLTEDQRTQMREELRGAFGRRREGGPPSAEDRKAVEEKILAVLTDPQKERWNALLGPPATLDMEKLRQSMGPRGFPGRRREGGQNGPRPETSGT